MAEQKKCVAAATGPWSDSDFLNLWEVEELCRQARKHGLPDESEFRADFDQAFLRTRYSVTHDPSKRSIAQMTPERTPVEQAIESRGDRLVSLNFVRSGDTRKPITVRIEVQDDATSVIMSSVDLDEHQFAGLLAGSVIRAKDAV